MWLADFVTDRKWSSRSALTAPMIWVFSYCPHVRWVVKAPFSTTVHFLSYFHAKLNLRAKDSLYIDDCSEVLCSAVDQKSYFKIIYLNFRLWWWWFWWDFVNHKHLYKWHWEKKKVIKPKHTKTTECRFNRNMCDMRYSLVTYASRDLGTRDLATLRFSGEHVPFSSPRDMPIRFRISTSSWISNVLSKLKRYSHLFGGMSLC